MTAAAHSTPARFSALGAHWLRPGDGVLDIGANIGTYARAYAARVGPTGYVLAVEPDPRAYEHLSAIDGIYPLRMAVSDGQPHVTLHTDAKQSVHSSCWKANTIVPGDAVMTAATTIDVMAQSVPHLRLIKIDTQGSEGDILDGAAQTLRRDNLVWVIELWPRGLEAAGRTCAAILDRFAVDRWELWTDKGEIRARAWWDAAVLRCEAVPHKSIDLIAVPRTIDAHA